MAVVNLPTGNFLVVSDYLKDEFVNIVSAGVVFTRVSFEETGVYILVEDVFSIETLKSLGYKPEEGTQRTFRLKTEVRREDNGNRNSSI